MDDASSRFLSLRDRLTVVRIRSHLLRYRFRGTFTVPGIASASDPAFPTSRERSKAPEVVH
jgi:hypothetical protein